MRCECGLDFVPGHPADEQSHARWHDEVFNGLPVTGLGGTQVGTLRDFTLWRCDGSQDRATRKAYADVALVAQRTMQDYPAGFDADSKDAVAYLLCSRERAVGLCLVAQNSAFWVLHWRSDGSVECPKPNAHDVCRRPTIGRVWVATTLQKQSLGTELVHFVASDFGLPVGEFGWELPLTRAGAALLRRLVPGTWFGRGDSFALEATLHPEWA